MGIADALKKVLSFLTALPVGEEKFDLEEVAEQMWLFPLVGLLMGYVAGVVGFVLSFLLPELMAKGVAFLALLALTGFNHLDGLLDVGDALMVRGPAERKVRVMKDTVVGTGGFAAGFSVLLLSFLAMNEMSAEKLVFALAIAESWAKLSMVVGAWCGKPTHVGMGSTFIGVVSGDNSKLFLATLVPLGASYLLFDLPGLLLLLLVSFSILMVKDSHIIFGGVSGDVFGAMNEVTRMVALWMMVWL